jgi:hypothetical protein
MSRRARPALRARDGQARTPGCARSRLAASRCWLRPRAQWNHDGVDQDPGCYEARYRVSRAAQLGLSTSFILLPTALGLMSVYLPVALVLFVLGAITALPAVAGLAVRRSAFRADYAGITLGAPTCAMAGHCAGIAPSSFPGPMSNRSLSTRGRVFRQAAGPGASAFNADRASRNSARATGPLSAARHPG